MWRSVSGNMMCLCIPALLFRIMTTPSLVGYYKCCTRRDCSMCSIYLSTTLVSTYTEHYILNVHYIKVLNTVAILLDWSDGFFCYLIIFCRASHIASHYILCYVHYNYKYLYPVMLSHCSKKVVKLLVARFIMMLNKGCFIIISMSQLYFRMLFLGSPRKKEGLRLMWDKYLICSNGTSLVHEGIL